MCTRGVAARGVGLVLGEGERGRRGESLRGTKRWETEVEGEGGKDKPVVISADDGMIRGVVY